MIPASEPLLAAPKSSKKVTLAVSAVLFSGMLAVSAYVLASPKTHAAMRRSSFFDDLEANSCPADNGGCCLDCEHNRYCPMNQGCYSASQPGCDVELCPPLAKVTTPSTTSTPKSTRVFRDCSFHECEQAGCDRVANPFLCVTPAPRAPYMACSADPWTDEVCPNACSVAHCGKAKPSPHEPTCKTSCPAERCAQINAPVPQQRCGVESPFQCLAGSAALGCSADEFHYAAVPDVQCSSCCDVTTCSPSHPRM